MEVAGGAGWGSLVAVIPTGRRASELAALTLALSTLAVVASPATARAQSEAPAADAPSPDDIAEASRLYEQGTAAHAAGRFDAAARAFAAADDRVPDAAALEAALLAVLETDDAVLATRLATRTARAPFDEALSELAERARRRFADRVGRVVVHCDGCAAEVDGERIVPGIASVVEVGTHEVTIAVGARTERRSITVEPSSIVTLLPVASPEPVAPDPVVPSPEPASPATTGPSPAWFWVGVGLTGAALGGTIASAVDTASKRADFEAEPSPPLAEAGEAAQLRTNALIGVTAGLAVITGVVGLFVVDWGDDAGASSPPPARAGLGPPRIRLSVGPLGASLRASFR